ncbi:MAG: glycosyltransferase family 2 protein [Chloroflexi bacterium]|nr:glycosyltransferase family 2 protein [Chloroflexota bacterium]
MNTPPKQPKYSAIIPVYNSAPIVGDTLDRTVAFFEQHGFDYEVVAVNDGSRDGSWEVVRAKAEANPRIVAINLLRNYGQHTAVLCGFKNSVGDYVITLDDDLQNPPEEMIHLIRAAEEGHDVVFGRFRQKQHAGYRRWGSRLVGLLNTRIFRKPEDLTLSNFRIIRRDVVERICAYRTTYPYIPGLILMFSGSPANVWVEHRSRPVGKSNYNWLKIAELVMRILFNYSSFPLRLASTAGAAVAIVSFLLGFFYLIRALVTGFAVAGWATLVVMLAFFNGLLVLMMSMLGEYVVRLLNQASSAESYHIGEALNRHV